jgi:hypothetical protein
VARRRAPRAAEPADAGTLSQVDIGRLDARRDARAVTGRF